MFLSQYYSEKSTGIAVSESQASHFAKTLAGDFNPIHDEGARKFCVPGDLLFALLVSRFGVFTKMNFQFLGLVGADVGLQFPTQIETDFEITNEKGKPVVGVQVSGPNNKSAEFGEALVREYVAFSGQNFPHILVPLMAEKGVMINPARPLVMYESMSIQFDDLNVDGVTLALSESSLEVNGKRGQAQLGFDLMSGERQVGRGAKQLALGGLLPFDQQTMDQVVADYEAKKAEYQNLL